MISGSELSRLLLADGGDSALRCAHALEGGARLSDIRQSTELELHLHWLNKHRARLSEHGGEAEVNRFGAYLTAASTRSVLLTTVGLLDQGDEYFTVALDPAGERIISCLAYARELPRRAAEDRGR